MTVYYIDPDGGNDANDGLSFATRRQTTNGLNTSGTHEFRFMAGYNVVNLGSATWADNSTSVILPVEKTLNVDTCDNAWTAVTNVTATSSNSTSSFSVRGMHREGSGYARITAVSAFTTGKMAYRTLDSTLDLSAYTAISFRWGHSSTTASIQMRLDLCSDTTGDTPILSINLPMKALTAYSYNFLYENGAALPPGVNSVALYAVNDPGTLVFGIDNIIACQSRDHADHLSHSSLIGKNSTSEPAWYPIRSINGTTVNIGDMMATVSVPRRGYRGISESVNTYCQPVQIQSILASQSTLGVTDYTFSGGWNRLDMSDQTGNDTFISGNGLDYGFSSRTNGTNNTHSSRINLVSFTNGFIMTAGDFHEITAEHFVDMLLVGSSLAHINYTIDYFQHCHGTFAPGTSMGGEVFLYFKSKRWDGCGDTTKGIITDSAGIFQSLSPLTLTFDISQISNCGVGFGGGGTYCQIFLKNCTFVNNGSDLASIGNYSGQSYLDNCTFSNPYTASQAGVGGQMLVWTNKGGDINNCGYIVPNYNLFTQTTTVPPSQTWAWQMHYFSGKYGRPITHNMFSFYVSLGKSYTVEYQTRRNDSSIISVGVLVEPNQAEHLDNFSGTVNTWSTRTLSFTSSSDGIAQFNFGGQESSTGTPTLSAAVFFGSVKVTEA